MATADPLRTLRRAASALLLLVGGCISEAECERRIEAAEGEALRDAAACRYAPDALFRPDCGGSDRRPWYTYVGVWCSTAELACLDDQPVAEEECFGGPSD